MIQRQIDAASLRWPGLEFKRKTRDEASSACPFCAQADTDGFLIFAAGNYWCRKCGIRGWIDENQPREVDANKLLEARIAELERKQREQDERLSALERMHKCTDHLAYHRYLESHPELMDYWLYEGITTDSIIHYKLGYCHACPTYQASPSYTIPVVNRGKLENIRHRLVMPGKAGKYRPHMSGLGSVLFNVDTLDAAQERIVVVEGEKKSIVAAQTGIANVGICGQRTFNRAWLPWFSRVQDVIFALDPDAMESSYVLARLFGGRARVASLPRKIDDMIAKDGATRSDLEAFFRVARPVAA